MDKPMQFCGRLIVEPIIAFLQIPKARVLVLIAFFAASQSSWGSLYEAWRHAIPSDGGLNQSSEPIVTAAPDGSIYFLSHYSQTELVIECYDANGALRWNTVLQDTRSINSPRTILPFTAACDLSGNLLVAARMGTEHILLKYDASGALLWNSRVPHSFQEWEKPFSLLAGPEGTAFLCFNGIVFGFDNKGFNMWERALESPSFGSAFWSTARLVFNNPIIAGRVSAIDGQDTAVIATISAFTGTVQFFTAPASFRSGLALDSEKNLYGVDSSSLVRLNFDGSIAWETQIREFGHNWGGRTSVLVDERNDCIFVFVSNVDSTPKAAYLYRVSMDGELQWSREVGTVEGANYFGGTCVLDNNGGVFVAGRRQIPYRNGDMPTREVFFLQQISSRPGNSHSSEITEDRAFWENSFINEARFTSALGLSAAALPGGGIALASRLRPEAEANLICLRPAAAHYPGFGITNWSIGTFALTEFGFEGPFELSTDSYRQGGYWEEAPPGYLSLVGGYFRISKDWTARILAAQPAEETLGFEPSVDPGRQVLLPPKRISLRTATGWGSVLRWTVPHDGEFIISGLFHSLPGPGQSTATEPLPIVRVRHGTNSLATFPATGETQFPFNFKINAKFGETVDFLSHPVLNAVEGVPFVPEYIGVQAEISVPNNPPSVSVRSSGGLVWSNGVARLQLNAAVNDPEGEPVQVEFLVDGKLVSLVNSPPYSELIDLPPGHHLLSAKVRDAAGTISLSPSLYFDVPAEPSDEIFIPADSLQEELFTVIALDRLETHPNPDLSLGVRMLIDFTIQLEENYGNMLTDDFLDAFFKSAYAEISSASEAAARRQGTVRQSTTPPDAIQTYRSLFSAIACGPAKAWGCSVAVKWAADWADHAVGRWVDDYSDRRDREEMLRADSEMLRKVSKMRLERPALARAVDDSATGVLKVKTSDSPRAILDKVAADSTLKGFPAKDIQSLLTENDDLRASSGDLSILASTSFAKLREGIETQAEISGEIMALQRDMNADINNEIDRARIAEAEARADQVYQETVAGARMTFDLIGSLIGGENGRVISVTGNSFITIADSINKLSKLSQEGLILGFGGLVASGNIVGAVMSFVSLFVDSGPTPEEMILDEIGELKQMVAQLGEQMHERFNRIDEQLARIYDDFSKEFNQVDYRLTNLQAKMQTLGNLTTNLNERVARIEFEMQDLFRAQGEREYALWRSQLRNFESNAIPMTTEAFVNLSTEFHLVPTFHATDSIALGSGRDANSPDWKVPELLTGTNDTLAANLNFLNDIVRNRRWMGGYNYPLSADKIPAAYEWAFGADGLNILHTRWPQFARANGLHAAQFEEVIEVGESIRTALERITLIRSGSEWKTNALWGHLIQNYRNKAAQFLASLQSFETAYLIGIAEGDANRELGMSQINLWGRVDQPNSYIPSSLRTAIQPLRIDGQPFLSDAMSIDPPLNVYALFEANGEIPLLELLKAENWAAYYEGVSFTSERTRCSGKYGTITPNFVFTQKGNLQEAFFNLTLSLKLADGTKLAWSYGHPKRHFYGFVVNNGGFVQWTKSGQKIYSDCGGQYQTDGSQSWMWSNWASLINRFWYGGYEPVLPEDRVDDNHLISSVRKSFVANAFLDYPDDLRLGLQQRVEDSLRFLQGNYLGGLTNEIRISGTDLGKSALELTGARELLRVFVELGLPISYQQSDVLRALFTGSDGLPDLSVLLSFCEEAKARSLSSGVHTGRPDFAGLLNNRITALETVLNELLAEIQVSGEAEILPLVANTLLELKVTQEATLQPLKPYLFTQLVAPDPAMVRLLGERYVQYTVEWSSNLVHWISVPGTIIDGQSVPLDLGIASSGFLRARAN